MIRGTTPTETYTIKGASNLDLTRCAQIWATITDKRGNDYTWGRDRLVVDNENKTISLTLTQEETLDFVAGEASVQIRFLYDGGEAFATKPLKFAIENARREGVIYE